MGTSLSPKYIPYTYMDPFGYVKVKSSNDDAKVQTPRTRSPNPETQNSIPCQPQTLNLKPRNYRQDLNFSITLAIGDMSGYIYIYVYTYVYMYISTGCGV